MEEESGFAMTQLNIKVNLISWKNALTKLFISNKRVSPAWYFNKWGWEDISLPYYTHVGRVVLLNYSLDGVLEERLYIEIKNVATYLINFWGKKL